MPADPSRDRPQPTADGLFLRAHDACHSAASRFERFTALLDGIDSVYGLAVKDRRHDAADAAALVDARETILVPRWNVVVQQGARYMQVSAVELARDILFETCRSWTDRKPLYSSERVVRPAPCLLVAVCRLRAADCLSTQIEMLKLRGEPPVPAFRLLFLRLRGASAANSPCPWLRSRTPHRAPASTINFVQSSWPPWRGLTTALPTSCTIRRCAAFCRARSPSTLH